jgi:antitoxin component of MazEF toxin-antitoxin module
VAQLPVISVGDSAAVILPLAVLESLGLKIGDVMDVTLEEHRLILRPANDSARRQVIEEITREMFERRRDAFQRLA